MLISNIINDHLYQLVKIKKINHLPSLKGCFKISFQLGPKDAKSIHFIKQILKMDKFILKIRYFCSNLTKNNSQVLQSAYSVFQAGKASVSISQHIAYPEKCQISSFSNYYIHHNQCGNLNASFDLSTPSLDPSSQAKALQMQKTLRIIIQAEIGKKQINLDINSLRKNKIIDELIKLQQRSKYHAKSSIIVIDDEITDNGNGQQVDMTKQIQKNILQAQKLLETGCSLSVAYMLSNKNIQSTHWIDIVKRKNKSIHSNIVQKLGHNSSMHKSLEQFVFNNGFRLQHLFLKPYKNGEPVQSIQQANNFDLKEIVNVLNIIDFQGKIILENNQKFVDNVTFLQEALKKGGFLKKKLGDSEGPLWYLFL